MDLSSCFPFPSPCLSLALSLSFCAGTRTVGSMNRPGVTVILAWLPECLLARVLVPSCRNRFWLFYQVGKTLYRKSICCIIGSLRKKVQAVSRGLRLQPGSQPQFCHSGHWGGPSYSSTVGPRHGTVLWAWCPWWSLGTGHLYSCYNQNGNCVLSSARFKIPGVCL